MSKQNTAFAVGQKVVYPSQGVGIIKEILKKRFKDTDLLYYQIYLDVSEMVIMVPVDRADELGLRAIVPKEEAEKALEMIGGDFEPLTSDWKLRYQMNLDLLKKGTVMDIATIVRSLYHRSKVKDLPIQERKLYDSAKKLFIDEISFSLDIPAKEIESMIHEKLEPIGAILLKSKSVVADDDDEDFADDAEVIKAKTGDDDDADEDEEKEAESETADEDDNDDDEEE
jgi:CarD family transcriptional regulator